MCKKKTMRSYDRIPVKEHVDVAMMMKYHKKSPDLSTWWTRLRLRLRLWQLIALGWKETGSEFNWRIESTFCSRFRYNLQTQTWYFSNSSVGWVKLQLVVVREWKTSLSVLALNLLFWLFEGNFNCREPINCNLADVRYCFMYFNWLCRYSRFSVNCSQVFIQ